MTTKSSSPTETNFSLLCLIQRNQTLVFSSWVCSSRTKNMFVKIIHPGRHAELHDMPVLAVEIMLRNPRCCVVYPPVFQQPWEIVAPDTMLIPGQKFYVVPLSTIGKLQRVSSSKNSVSSSLETEKSRSSKEEEEDNGIIPSCWLYKHKSTLKLSPACTTNSDSEGKNENHTGRKSTAKKKGKEDNLFNDNCYISLLMGMKLKGSGGDLREETRSESSRTNSTTGPPETKALTMKRTNKHFRRNGMSMSLMRLSYLDHWQPNLESITEE